MVKNILPNFPLSSARIWVAAETKERLSGDLASYWSRQIDDANRIVYRIDDNMIKIVQCGSHYRGK
ncbi:MAG: type II toxin-antitoxin system YoeB family toxin [Lachnospiraceae bacterium]|nr:type II toxin-antitoxin system YoeB family toxin [Lachnospiraceae bacterium]